MRKRFLGLGLTAGMLALALSGCATPPGPPLMSAVDVAHGYGYSEHALGDNKMTVTYLGPLQGSSFSQVQHDSDAQRARDQAFDFAVWRASQLAVAQGFQGFHVADKQVNLDTVTQPSGYYDDPFCGSYGGYGGWGGWGGYGRWGGWGGWGAGSDCFYEPPSSDVQARAIIDIELLQKLAPGDYNASDSIAQLQRTYPGAENTPYQGTAHTHY